ncbi:MAG TPA: DUF6585 family protein [Aggregatilineaceae bacterium]|nr:DUF6585 family protein [Aggregatilineaceae bacterium]
MPVITPLNPFGRLIAVYQISFGKLAILLSAAVGMAGLGAYLVSMISYSPIGILFILIGILALAYFITHVGCRVELYEKGLKYHSPLREKSWRWTDLDTMITTDKVIQQRVYGIPLWRFHYYDYSLFSCGEKVLSLNGLYRNPSELGAQLMEKTAEYILPLWLTQMAQGNLIYFNSIAISKDGLGSVPWSSFLDMGTRDGNLVLMLENQQKKYVRIQGKPNAHVFVMLIEIALHRRTYP